MFETFCFYDALDSSSDETQNARQDVKKYEDRWPIAICSKIKQRDHGIG
jgi:hypothetical protein